MIVGTPFRETPLSRWLPLGVLAVAGALGWVLAAARPRVQLSRPALAALVLLATTAVTSVTSVSPSISIAALARQVLLSGVALLVWHVATSPRGRRDLLALAGTLFAVIVSAYLAQVAAFLADWLRLGYPIATFPLRPGQAGGLVGIPTWLGDYVVLLAPSVAVALWPGDRRGRWAAGVVVLAGMAALLASGTRSLWLLAALVGGVVATVAITRRWGSRGLAAVTAPAVGLAVLSVGLAFPDRVARDLDEGRMSAYATALAAFAERPLFGTGPGTYGIVRLDDDIPFVAWYAFPNAHNVPLTILAEGGLIAAIGAAVAAALLVAQLRETWTSASPVDRRLAVAALASLAVTGGHALVDVVFEVDGIVVLAFLVASFALVPAADVGVRPSAAGAAPVTPTIRSEQAGRWLARVPGLLGVAAAMGIGALAVPVERAAFALYRADALWPDDRSAAVSELRAATLVLPDLAPAWSRLARALDAGGDRRAAIVAAAEAVRAEPLAQHRIELAVLLLAAGRTDEARAELALAARSRADPFVQLNVAMLLARLGDRPGSDDALDRLLETEPTIARPLAFAGREVLGSAFADRLADAVRRGARALVPSDPRRAMLLAMAADDAALVDELVGDAGNPLVAEIARAWRGDEVALAPVRTRARQPRGEDVDLWWYVAVRSCDRELGTRLAETRRILVGRPPAIVTAVGRAPELRELRLPDYYPGSTWGVGPDPHGYVAGAWTYRLGSPTCLARGAATE